MDAADASATSRHAAPLVLATALAWAVGANSIRKEEIEVVGALARLPEIFLEPQMEMEETLTRVYPDRNNKRPRNFRVPDPVNRKAEGYNPLCGDKITVFLYVEGDTIKDLAFQGTGCAISKASASMMTDELKGQDRSRGRRLLRKIPHHVDRARDIGRRDGRARQTGRPLGCA